MAADFERQSFGEEILGPHSPNYGTLFFWLPRKDYLRKVQLYFPEVVNPSENENLVFLNFKGWR